MRRSAIAILIVTGSTISVYSQDREVIWNWLYLEDDVYYDFSLPEQEGFVETSESGHMGGALQIVLPETASFRKGVSKYFSVEGLPDGLEAEMTVDKSSAMIQLSGIAKKYLSSYQNLNISIGHKAIRGKVDRNSLHLDNIRIKSHSIPGRFISPVTKKVYQLVFNDEFNEEQVNTSRWAYRGNIHGSKTRTIKHEDRDIDIIVENDASTTTGRALKLDVRWDEDHRKIITGGINTSGKFLARYGYYETKVSFRDCHGIGYWPAFWIHFVDSTRYTNGTEIDVFEFIPRDKEVFHTLHWYKKDSSNTVQQHVQHFDTTTVQSQKKHGHFSSTQHFELDNSKSKPHVFAVEWTPEELIFYTNGQVTRRVDKSKDPREVPAAYQMIYFSCSAGTWGGNVAMEKNTLPSYVYFDYCRVYQEAGQDAYYLYDNKPQLIRAEDRYGKY